MLTLLKKLCRKKAKSETACIKEEIHRSERFGYNFGIIIMERKGFSMDNLAKTFSMNKNPFHELKNYLRPYDRLIQENNKRYCVILPQTDDTGCSIVKERIYNYCQKFNIKDVLMGSSIYPYDGTSAGKLLQSAHDRSKKYQEDVPVKDIELNLL